MGIKGEPFRTQLESMGFTDLPQDDKRRIIWDIWKFFQSKFVDALEEWGVGDPEVLKNMRYMKEHRAEFDKMPFNEVKEYCYDECAYMATLARKLWEAHNTAGLRACRPMSKQNEEDE